MGLPGTDEVVITVDDTPVTNFSFQANNVLVWETPAHSAWLLFSELPAGPYFVGSLCNAVRVLALHSLFHSNFGVLQNACSFDCRYNLEL